MEAKDIEEDVGAVEKSYAQIGLICLFHLSRPPTILPSMTK